MLLLIFLSGMGDSDLLPKFYKGRVTSIFQLVKKLRGQREGWHKKASLVLPSLRNWKVCKETSAQI